VAPGSAEAFRWTLVAGTVIAALALVPLLLMGEARRHTPPTDHATATAAEPLHVRRRVRRDMQVFVLVGGIMSLGAGMVFPFYNVYLKTLGASAGEVGIVYALGGLCAAVIGLGAPALGRRIGSLWAVFLVRNAILPFYLLLIVVPGYGVAVMAHLVRQTSISMAWPLDSTFISEVLPPRARSSVFGLRSGVWNLGWSGASLLGGWIIVQAGYGWPFASLIFFTFISTVIYVGYYGRHPLVQAGEVPSALPRGRRLAEAAALAAADTLPAAESLPAAAAAEPERPRSTA
jgi:PPP family 3-phenylpropionic acid transporter